MFAVVKTGGKQYKVAVGDTIKVEKLEHEVGQKVSLGDVLMISENDKVIIGSPILEQAKVEAEVMAQKKTDKVIIFKKKRRQNYRRKKGHRQNITVLKITTIKAA